MPAAPFVRIHLRPYRARGGEWPRLLEAFLASAGVPARPERFQEEWQLAARYIQEGRLPLSERQWAELDFRARGRGYPAMHHSPEYQRAYRPAYRVVALELGCVLD
jgi:hypothetical protein